MFIYYFERQGAEAFTIPRCLQYAIDRGASVQNREVLSGPDGHGAGWLFRVDAKNETTELKFETTNQQWVRIHAPDGPVCYVGRWNADKLEPGKLARPTQLEHHPVALGDGTVWAAAVARGFDVEAEWYYTPLPKTLAFDATTGQWKPTKVAKEYRRFLELAQKYADAHDKAVGEQRTKFEFVEIDELAMGAITANYRVSHAELALFEDVYTVAVRDALVNCALDFPTIKRWVDKKKESDAATPGS
jgi:hypothetical protein